MGEGDMALEWQHQTLFKLMSRPHEMNPLPPLAMCERACEKRWVFQWYCQKTFVFVAISVVFSG